MQAYPYLPRPEMAVGQWVMDHGSHGSTNLNAHAGHSWVSLQSTCDPMIYDLLTDD